MPGSDFLILKGAEGRAIRLCLGGGGAKVVEATGDRSEGEH
ncbi:hypothetical protein ACFQRC_10900 [Enterovirga sp. GCM10030262]